jgi:chromate transporter
LAQYSPINTTPSTVLRSATLPSLSDWVWINLKIGLLSFGGSGRIFLYRDAVVTQRGWITPEEFQEIFTLTQILPGPNIVNLSVYLGHRLAGKGAATAGLAALALPGALMAAGLYGLIGNTSPLLGPYFKGFAIASIILWFDVFLNLAPGLFRGAGASTKTLRKKVAALVVTALVAAAVLANFPISAILAGGLAAGLLVEFLP